MTLDDAAAAYGLFQVVFADLTRRSWRGLRSRCSRLTSKLQRSQCLGQLAKSNRLSVRIDGISLGP